MTSIRRPTITTYLLHPTSDSNLSIKNDVNKNKNGYDERFPVEQTKQTDQIYNISVFLYYLEQIKRIEKYSFPNVEEVKADTVVSDLFPGISRIRLKAGGLMDDWERNDFEYENNIITRENEEYE